MPAERLLPTTEAEDLIKLTREIARDELAPVAVAVRGGGPVPARAVPAARPQRAARVCRTRSSGAAAACPYEVYLQVLEEIATAWMSIGVGLSVHVMSCFALAEHGTDEQRARWLPDMLGGELLGAYALSEPQAGSDAAALTCRAVLTG